MKNIDKVDLALILQEQETEVVLEQKKRVGLLVKDILNKRESTKRRIQLEQDNLLELEQKIEAIKNGDWSVIDWKKDGSEI